MTNIEWTDRTWNPMTGCDRVSPGCGNCYAAGVAHRFWGARPFGDVQFHPDRVEQPHGWRKSQRIFVNSMSDFFHEAISDEQRDMCLAAMFDTPHHTYQVLTKRPHRMRRYLDVECRFTALKMSEFARREVFDVDVYWPLPNVWWGVSIENQRYTKRIATLLSTPAAIRFLSCEPLLGPINFDIPCTILDGLDEVPSTTNLLTGVTDGLTPMYMGGIDWVIVGGESGPGARPCHVEWLRDIVAQCKAANVPVFIKQTGANCWLDDRQIKVQGGTKGGDPEWLDSLDLLVREFPTP